MRNGYSLGNRLLALALAFVLILGMLPVRQSAAVSTEFGSVSALTAGTVNGSETAASTVTVSSATLEWSVANPDAGRNQDGWWVGIMVNAPEGADLTLAQYKQSTGEAKNFLENKDTETGIQLWGLVNEAYLNQFISENRNMNYIWQFDWDGNNEYEQTVTITVVPSGIVLNKNGVQVYPVPLVGFGTVSSLTAGTVSGNETVASTVTVDSAVLTWSAADASAGRNQDGWWLGLMVNAPADADLSKVMYLSSGSSTPKSFNENKDTENGIQLWGLVNQTYLDQFISENRNMNYNWQFDWNGDGKYEQTVTLSVNPKGIILKQGGVQVYPALGVVSTYTGGTVTGSKTSNVEVLVEEVTLNYTNGGGTNAWWVGIKAEAPAYLSNERLQNAKYQTKSGPNSGWSGEKSFWSNKDSADGDAAQYIQLWFPLTPETLEKFKAENRNITMWYRFDWDGNGEYEQNITFSVVPSEKIVLNPVEQAGFGFGTEKNITITYAQGLTFWKEAEGELSGEEVIYEILDQKALIEGKKVAELVDGELKILNAGTITIKATSPAAGIYAEATDTYTLTVAPAPFKLTVKDASKIFGDKDPKFEYVLDQTLPENVSLNVRYTGEAGEDLGKYRVEAIVTVYENGEVSKNYACEVIPGTLTIAERIITVTVNNASKIYGDADPVYTYTLSEALPEEVSLAVNYNRADGKGIGDYKIEATVKVYKGSVDCTANCAITVVPGTLTIEERPITVKVADAFKYYGVWQDPEFTAEITEGDLVEGETIAYNLTREEGNAKGSYTINAAPVVSSGTEDCTANYDITVETGTLTIGQMSNEDFGDQYTLDPAEANDNGWYDGDVTIVPNEGYGICDSNGNLKVENWTDKKIHSTEGTSDVSFYLKRESDGAVSDEFTITLNVDKTDPQIAKVKIDKAALNVVLEKLTFGFFKSPVTILVEADDVISGVDYIELTYSGKTGEYSTSEVKETLRAENLNKASFNLPDNFKGSILVTVYDKTGNTTEQNYLVDAEGNSLDVIVVDSKNPGRTVKFSQPGRIVSNEDLADVVYEKGSDNTVAIPEGDEVTLYYNTDATIILTIDEQNFYEEDVIAKVNGVETDAVVWEQTSNDGEFTGTLILQEEGDHVVTMEYTDKSTNEMDPYTSQRIVIDKTAPVIKSIVYSNTDVKNTIDGREYYDADQTVTITIAEENFRADDVQVLVKAKDLNDNDVAVDDYAAIGANRASWTPYEEGTWRRVDNTYVLELTFDKEANYDIVIKYDDLATNEVESEHKLFTVDKTAPELESLKVEYSQSVIEKVIEKITFGYYNAQMTVTISAEDDISPIHSFSYSYLLNPDVSHVNAELINKVIESDDITQKGNTGTAEFKIPAEALTASNQFNGYVTFYATNRSGLVSEEKTDNENVIIVDNISPVSNITYNNPVQTLDNVHYYDGEIQATIQINEANFFSEEVHVTVTKDGVNYPVTVHWVDNTVNLHTGSFVLTEDGDYIVSVTYTDRSGNQMADYTSAQMTIDTQAPVVEVTGINHQSANNGETLSLIVTVTDVNIELENIKPVLTAVIKKETGANTYTFETVEIELGNAVESANENGETVYTYTIDNLEIDGFYSLICETADNSNHVVTQIRSKDSAGSTVAVGTMNFSVNRNGSVFWVETEHNDKYTGEIFNNQLDNAYVNDTVAICVHEINVDKVDEDENKRTVLTLNNGSTAEDIVLDENSNYDKNVSVGQGGWYESIYTLDNSVFDKDGAYSFNIITHDAANNSNVNTKSESGTIRFIVDRTAPVVSANIKTNQRIDAEKYVVEFKITDANLDLNTVTVTFNGETVVPEELGNNEYAFEIGEGLNHTVEITATDKAGNAAELYRVERLTVSTNFFVRWYANSLAFWGTLGGVGGGGLLLILFLIAKKKKKA